MRSSRRVYRLEEGFDGGGDGFWISITPRQMQFINLLKSRGGRESRSRLYWEIGTSVDHIANSLIQKGLVVRERRGIKIYYALTKMGWGERGNESSS